MPASAMIVLLISALSLPLAIATDSQGAPPRVAGDLVRRDLVFYRDEKQRVEIPFSIPGDLPFVVLAVRRSCSCVEVVAPDSPIQPGVPHRLVLTMNAGSLLGVVEAYVQIVGTLGDAPACINLLLHGEVRDYIEWPPGAVIDLGTHAMAELPVDLRFQLRPGTHPQHIDAITATVVANGGIASSTLTMHGPDRWDLDLRLAAQGVCGVLSGEIELACADGGLPLPYHPHHPFTVTITGPLQAHPSGILLGPVPHGTRRRAVVALAGSAGALRATPSDAARMACALVSDAGRQLLQADFTGSGPAGNASGSIDVAIQGGGVLRIPYYASVLPALGEGAIGANR